MRRRPEICRKNQRLHANNRCICSAQDAYHRTATQRFEPPSPPNIKVFTLTESSRAQEGLKRRSSLCLQELRPRDQSYTTSVATWFCLEPLPPTATRCRTQTHSRAAVFTSVASSPGSCNVLIVINKRPQTADNRHLPGSDNRNGVDAGIEKYREPAKTALISRTHQL